MESKDLVASSSRLWNSAWGTDVQGPPWAHDDTTCVMCGAAVKRGDLGVPAGRKRFDQAFNFKLDVKFKGDAVCGDCVAVWQNFWMQKGSKSYAVMGEGVFWLSKNTDIAAFILSPPKAEYVAIFNSRQQAQMIWRTPVAMPSNLLQVRIDDDLMVIDRDRVMRGVRAWQTACSILVAVGQPKGAPFLLSYNLASSATGMRHPTNASAVEKHSQEGVAAVAVLSSLSMADWWALSACRELDLDKPESWPTRRRITQEDTKRAPKNEDEEDEAAAAE
jgi:CRISPR type IV-associated protein Csf1